MEDAGTEVVKAAEATRRSSRTRGVPVKFSEVHNSHSTPPPPPQAKAPAKAAAKTKPLSKPKSTSSRKRPAVADNGNKNNNNNNSRKKAKSTTSTTTTLLSKKNATRKNPKRAIHNAPKTLQDENGNTVYIAALHLADIQSAQRSGKHPHCGSSLARRGQQLKRQYLHTISSPAQRELVYNRAVKALQDIETALLPTYGGRRWKVQVTMTDPVTTTTTNTAKSSKKKVESPYFVFGTTRRGVLELAAWPQILSKIPSPPKFPGYYSSSQSKDLAKIKKKKQRRQQQQQTKQSANDTSGTEEEDDDDKSIPPPPHEQEEAGDDDDDEEEDDDDDDDEPAIVVEDETEWELILDLQERDVTPLSQLAYQERSRVPLPNITTKWISPLRELFYSRKSAWDHAVQLCQQQVVLHRVLHGYDLVRNRPLAATTVLPRKKVLDVGLMRFQRDGLWVVGQEEMWKTQPSTEVQDEAAETSAGDVHRRKKEEEQKANDQQSKRPYQRRLTGLQCYINYYRCEVQARRQDEIDEAHLQSSSSCRRALDMDPSATHINNLPNDTSNGKPPTFTLRQADNELRDTWKTLTAQEQEEWKQKAAIQEQQPGNNQEQHQQQQQALEQETRTNSEQCVSGSTVVETPPLTATTATPTKTTIETPTMEEGHRSGVLDEHEEMFPRNAVHLSAVASPVPKTETAAMVTPDDGSCVLEVSYHGASSALASSRKAESCQSHAKRSIINSNGRVTPSSAEDDSCEDMIITSATTTPANGKALDTEPTAVSLVASRKAATQRPPPTKSSQIKSASTKLAPWTKWCLNKEQVKLCYDAGIDHYDTVIATVMARDLHRELQDGFDVLRERGRGRFDMELPVFDSPEFSFLTDLTLAPWMPVVRQILGQDVVLIHKGMFLSMPGCDAQQYHQDGLHLTTQTQRDCHAVNVFVPLVDLTMKHGPTEFCLGTHILDQEGYKAKFAETPLVKAGTPILFDYRLGHKGLANTSGTCRPIVYCTYAKSVVGRGEFKDKVNFSRSRYHRIGDLVSHKKVPSREERAEKRQLRALMTRLAMMGEGEPNTAIFEEGHEEPLPNKS
ncbi:hypothetical protein ACA910_008933 [Epithemia clementina (nom. ined.)]